MAALSKFLTAGANYFLKKKSRTEQNQLLILQRMSEMQEEGRQTGARIEGQIVSLREDIAEEAKILLSIREDNEEALKRHCERQGIIRKVFDYFRNLARSIVDRLQQMHSHGRVDVKEAIRELRQDGRSFTKADAVRDMTTERQLNRGPRL